MFLAVSIPSNVFAGGVQVFPVYLFLNAPTRSVTLSVTNPLERPQEAWVEFRYGYPVPGDSGKFAMRYVDPPYTGEPSAVPWMKAYPQRFIMGPKESQVIRVVVAPPLGVQPGEYWARVVVSSTDQTTAKPANPGGGITMKLKYINQIDVPFHFRTGGPKTGLLIRGVQTTLAAGKMNLGIDVNRTGNAAFWGKLTVTIRNRDGKILKNDDHPVAIYKDLLYPASIDITTIPPGTYTLDVVFTSRRPGMQSRYLLTIDPVRFSQELVIP
jgi:hypothetical protein